MLRCFGSGAILGPLLKGVNLLVEGSCSLVPAPPLVKAVNHQCSIFAYFCEQVQTAWQVKEPNAKQRGSKDDWGVRSADKGLKLAQQV